MVKSKEELIKEIERLEIAIAKTESKYLKADYGKAVKRKRKELRKYDGDK